MHRTLHEDEGEAGTRGCAPLREEDTGPIDLDLLAVLMGLPHMGGSGRLRDIDFGVAASRRRVFHHAPFLCRPSDTNNGKIWGPRIPKGRGLPSVPCSEPPASGRLPPPRPTRPQQAPRLGRSRSRAPRRRTTRPDTLRDIGHGHCTHTHAITRTPAYALKASPPRSLVAFIAHRFARQHPV